jgi:hypothetical protein
MAPAAGSGPSFGDKERIALYEGKTTGAVILIAIIAASGGLLFGAPRGRPPSRGASMRGASRPAWRGGAEGAGAVPAPARGAPSNLWASSGVGARVHQQPNYLTCDVRPLALLPAAAAAAAARQASTMACELPRRPLPRGPLPPLARPPPPGPGPRPSPVAPLPTAPARTRPLSRRSTGGVIAHPDFGPKFFPHMAENHDTKDPFCK